MDVWAPVVAGIGSGLITAFAGYFAGISQWKREREAAKDERAAVAKAARHDEMTQLRRELVTAFVEGRAAIGRAYALLIEQKHETDAYVLACNDIRAAAQRLVLAGERLAAEAQTEQAQLRAAALTAFVMEAFVAEQDHGLPNEWQWDSRLEPQTGKTVAALMSDLQRETAQAG